MRARIRKAVLALGSNYWFIPAVMSLFAGAMAFAAVAYDRTNGSGVLVEMGWSATVHPSGAREMLTVIAGSMIAVASTVFSITIAAVVYATGQYGPRLLNNFLADRGNKIALGTFIATFVYALLVLRTVREPDESGDAIGFVPELALLIAIGLAGVSVVVLIFFLHHAPSNIRINHVIAGIGRRILEEVDSLYPAMLGDTAPGAAADFDPQRPPTRVVSAGCTGYIQVIDAETLLSAAEKAAAVIHLRVQPGDFVHAASRVADIHGGSDATGLDESVQSAFAVGDERTTAQDMRFLFDELVEIALRALSPGVNDPFTARTSLDWIAAGLARIGTRAEPRRYRTDAAGALRMVADPVTFDSLVEATFGAIRQAAATNTEAALAQFHALASAAAGVEDPVRRAALRRQASLLADAARGVLSGPDLVRALGGFERLEGVFSEQPPGMDAFRKDAIVRA
jgi:uncharacterized membrane protein